MSFPKNLKYTKEHEWIEVSANSKEATIGVSAFAIEQLGDIVHLDLPKSGSSFDQGAAFGTIESTKTVSDLYMPIKGKVTAINENLKQNLEALQNDPYGQAWLIKIEISSADLNSPQLMSSQQYEAYLQDQ